MVNIGLSVGKHKKSYDLERNINLKINSTLIQHVCKCILNDSYQTIITALLSEYRQYSGFWLLLDASLSLVTLHSVCSRVWAVGKQNTLSLSLELFHTWVRECGWILQFRVELVCLHLILCEMSVAVISTSVSSSQPCWECDGKWTVTKSVGLMAEEGGVCKSYFLFIAQTVLAADLRSDHMLMSLTL